MHEVAKTPSQIFLCSIVQISQTLDFECQNVLVTETDFFEIRYSGNLVAKLSSLECGTLESVCSVPTNIFGDSVISRDLVEVCVISCFGREFFSFNIANLGWERRNRKTMMLPFLQKQIL